MGHLSDLDLNELRDMRARIEGEISRRERESEAQLAVELRDLLKKNGLKPEDLDAAFKGPSGRRNVLPSKYADPEDPSRTWSGKGRKPAWFRAALERGVSAKEMEI